MRKYEPTQAALDAVDALRSAHNAWTWVIHGATADVILGHQGPHWSATVRPNGDGWCASVEHRVAPLTPGVVGTAQGADAVGAVNAAIAKMRAA